MTPQSRAWRATAIAAGLLVTAFAIYWPAIHGQFIWDDAAYVTASPLVDASNGLYRMWFTGEPIDYWPVTNSMYWIECRLWAMNPTGYDVVNILVHAVNALLFWFLLRRLSIPGASLAASSAASLMCPHRHAQPRTNPVDHLGANLEIDHRRPNHDACTTPAGFTSPASRVSRPQC